MMFTILMCAAALAGQFVSIHAVSIVCGADLSMNITINASDTQYHGKIVRAISPCSGTYGPIANTADAVTITFCETTNPFVLETVYTFLFQDDADYWSDSDLLIAVTCEADTTDQVFNQSLVVLWDPEVIGM